MAQRVWVAGLAGYLLLLIGCASVEPTGHPENIGRDQSAVTGDRYCSSGIPDETGAVCCASTCKKLDNDELSVFPCMDDELDDAGVPIEKCKHRGTEASCCPKQIRNDMKSCNTNAPPCVIKPDTNCATGIKDANQNICCPKFCGTCGGSGCSGRLGGADNCCGGQITLQCSGASPPCRLDGPPGGAPWDPDPAHTFQHPGLLNNEAGLDLIASRVVSASSSPMKTAALDLQGSSRASWDYVPQPSVQVMVPEPTDGTNVTRTRWINDAEAAYQNALRWVAQGDNRSANAARDIIRAWAQTFRVVVPQVNDKAQVELEAAWRAPFFAYAAEIVLNHSTQWSGPVTWNELTKTKDMLRYLALTARGVLYKKNNQGPSGALALMAVGVFLNDT